MTFWCLREVNIKVGVGRAIWGPELVMIAKICAMEQPQDVASPHGGYAFMETMTL